MADNKLFIKQLFDIASNMLNNKVNDIIIELELKNPNTTLHIGKDFIEEFNLLYRDIVCPDSIEELYRIIDEKYISISKLAYERALSKATYKIYDTACQSTMLVNFNTIENNSSIKP